MPQLIEELNIADGVRREAAVLAMKYFMDRSYDAIEPLLELLYTETTNQSYIYDALRAIGDDGEMALCDMAINAFESGERNVAASALGRAPYGLKINNINGDDEQMCYPTVQVKSSLGEQLIVEVFEDQDGNVAKFNVVVNSRELLTRLKQSIETKMPLFRFEKPKTFSKTNPFISSPFKRKNYLILLEEILVVQK